MLVQHPQRNPCSPQKRGPIYKTPTEVLYAIFEPFAPPRTRDGLYTLLELTHVCQLWRSALVNKPKAWATVFVTQADRRSFVETCLERSYPISLEVAVDALSHGKVHPSCTCNKDERSRLVPNEVKPCEWHFAFETLAEKRHSERIRALNIQFKDIFAPDEEQVSLALETCQFFSLSSLPLTSLNWTDWRGERAIHLFSVPPFLPTLCSLSFKGPWNSQLVRLNRLTSFTFARLANRVDAERFRTFLWNNQSLETIILRQIKFKGGLNGPPVDLPNIKTFGAYFPQGTLSAIFRVPALRRLSSLLIATGRCNSYDCVLLCATGDEIEFNVRCDPYHITQVWQDLTGYARPTIGHVRLKDPWPVSFRGDAMTTLLMDAHTLELGCVCVEYFCPDLWIQLKKVGPQLKTVRFGAGSVLMDDCPRTNSLLGRIEDLVAYMFEHGRPISSVGCMMVSRNERQDSVWESFYRRRLHRYVRTGEVP